MTPRRQQSTPPNGPRRTPNSSRPSKPACLAANPRRLTMTKKPNDKGPPGGLPPDMAAAVMRNDLATFFRLLVWRVLKPHEALLWAPFLDLLCAVLQAVAEGTINRIIITVPPRF